MSNAKSGLRRETPALHARNVPAAVVGYEVDGRARVVLIEPLGSLQSGDEAIAALRHARPPRPGKPAHDFDFLHRKGLRRGGVVMLQRAVQEGRTVLARSIETLKRKDDLMDVRVVPRTLCCILPPSDSSTAMVEEAVLAFPRDAVKVRTISSVLEDIEVSLEEPCLYGPCGLLFRGPLPDGGITVHVVKPRGRREPGEIVRELLTSVPKNLLSLARNGGEPQWEAVPFVEVLVDPERQPRLSGQAANHSYVDKEGAMRFTLGTATLSLFGDAWVLSDATPLDPAAEAVSLDWPPGICG